jgi:hypothetical protein
MSCIYYFHKVKIFGPNRHSHLHLVSSMVHVPTYFVTSVDLTIALVDSTKYSKQLQISKYFFSNLEVAEVQSTKAVASSSPTPTSWRPIEFEKRKSGSGEERGERSRHQVMP